MSARESGFAAQAALASDKQQQVAEQMQTDQVVAQVTQPSEENAERSALMEQAGDASPRTFQKQLAGWFYDTNHRQVASERVLQDHDSALKQLVPAVEALTSQTAALATADQVAHDAAVYADRDGRRLLLGGSRIKAHFEAKGPAGMRSLLSDWYRSFRRELDSECRDWAGAIDRALVFPAPALFGTDRLIVDFESKVCRDEVCTALGRSPLRRKDWGDVTVRARLTQGQEANRKLVLAAFQNPAPGCEGRIDQPWQDGFRVQLAADTALVIIDGVASPFSIRLGLHSDTVQGLIQRAKGLLGSSGAGAQDEATDAATMEQDAPGSLPPPPPSSALAAPQQAASTAAPATRSGRSTGIARGSGVAKKQKTAPGGAPTLGASSRGS